jgi:hypothetical protein
MGLEYLSAKDAKDAKFVGMLDLVQVAAMPSRPEYSEDHNLTGFVQLDQLICSNGYHWRQSVVRDNNF